MMNNLSIKRKLLIYNIVIQVIILLLFSFSLYKTLELSAKDKLEATLKVILLDIADDIIEHKKDLAKREFDEEKEYKFEPLYIRLLKEGKTYKEIKNTNFPNNIKTDTIYLKNLNLNHMDFEYQEHYIISRLRFQMDKENYILEVATNFSTIDSTLENFIYILAFIVPVILALAIIGGYFLIYRSFLPIEKLLINLKNINAHDLSKRLESKNKNDEIDLLSQEINNLLQRLEISFNRISQFSSDASHELKTPLTIIRGEIDIALRKDRSKEEYKQSLQNCQNEVLTIQQTIDHLLFLAKSKDYLEKNIEDIYLDEITLEAINELQEYAKIKKISLDYKIEEAITISGHKELLKIAIKNIIKNAISFSFEKKEVKIKNYSDNDYYIISVQDSGIGIKKEDQEKIFEEFYRTDKSRNKESGGTGLGLAICKKIILLHHGIIELESEENKGTKIKFKFKK